MKAKFLELINSLEKVFKIETDIQIVDTPFRRWFDENFHFNYILWMVQRSV